MEINDTTKSIYQACRWYGLVPYSSTRNKLNQIIDLKLNRPLCAYSILLLIFFIVSIEYALFYDTYSGYSLRSKSTLSKYVYWMDLNILLAAYVIHTITSIFSVQNTLHVNTLLNKVDKHLNLLNSNNTLHSIGAKRRISFLILFALFSLILMLSVDFVIWLQLALKLKSDEQLHGNFRHDFNENQYYLIPFYTMYTSFVPLYGKCTTTIYRIGLRYRMLNDIICTHIAAADSLNQYTLDNKGLSDVTTRLFTIHETLGQVLTLVSSEFGLTILCLMLSSSFQIIICVYFLVSETLGNNDGVFVMTQTMWLISHVIRISVIVEPCHVVAIEAKRTCNCVSRLLRLNRYDLVLKHFWEKLMIDNIGFTLCGIFQIDRSLLTSIGGAIATYLVILFQFQH